MTQLLFRYCFAFAFGLLSFSFLWAADKHCEKCLDDYKVKPMPDAHPYFKPGGSDCYKIKSCPPVHPYFKPTGIDDYKIKSTPCVKPLDKGACIRDGGTGVNFFGLRPRLETHKKLTQP